MSLLLEVSRNSPENTAFSTVLNCSHIYTYAYLYTLISDCLKHTNKMQKIIRKKSQKSVAVWLSDKQLNVTTAIFNVLLSFGTSLLCYLKINLSRHTSQSNLKVTSPCCNTTLMMNHLIFRIYFYLLCELKWLENYVHALVRAKVGTCSWYSSQIDVQTRVLRLTKGLPVRLTKLKVNKMRIY